MKRGRSPETQELKKRTDISNGIQKFLNDGNSLMYMSSKERHEVLSHPDIIANPLMYENEYFNLYTKEIQYRNVMGYENLKDITNEVIPSKYLMDRGAEKNRLLSLNTDFILFSTPIAFNSLFKSLEKFENPKYGLQFTNTLKGDMKDYKKFMDSGGAKKSKIYHHSIIIDMISKTLCEYKQFVCIAGGYPMAYYIERAYNKFLPFTDVDLFIHSCDVNTANKIILLLNSAFNEFDDANSYVNENVVQFSCPGIKKYYGELKIQIIRRLYISPSQVIHGFDIDSTCILINMDGQFFCTERFYYAMANSCNTVNFDRLSASYEHRLIKYYSRGFDIWIPHSKFFKDNFLFDVNVLNKSMAIFARFFLNGRKRSTISDYDVGNRKITTKEERDANYYSDTDNSYKGEFLEFKTINPAEQISGTFHKIVLEDIKTWYPQLPVLSPSIKGTDFFDLDEADNEKFVEIPRQIAIGIMFARNITRKRKIPENFHVRIECYKQLINYIEQTMPGSYIFGNLVSASVGALYPAGTNIPLIIWNENELDKNKKNYIAYKLTTFYFQKYISSLLNDDVNIYYDKDTNIESETKNLDGYVKIVDKRNYDGFDVYSSPVAPGHKSTTYFERMHGYNVEFTQEEIRRAAKNDLKEYFKRTTNNTGYGFINKNGTFPRRNPNPTLDIVILNSNISRDQILEIITNLDQANIYYNDGKVFTTMHEYNKITNTINTDTEILPYNPIDKYMN